MPNLDIPKHIVVRSIIVSETEKKLVKIGTSITCKLSKIIV